MASISWDIAIAELEEYGLSVRAINLLEFRMGVIYLRDLRHYKRDRMLDGRRGLGPVLLGELYRAMRNYEAGRVVKGVEACMGSLDVAGSEERRELIRTGKVRVV